MTRQQHDGQMSWLMGQISNLATEECVDVLVVADLADRSVDNGGVNLADVLVRAAHLPGLSLQFLSTNSVESSSPLPAEDSVDLAMVRLSTGAHRVDSMLKAHQRHCGSVLRVQRQTVTLSSFGRLPESTSRWDGIDDSDTHQVFATDQPGHERALRDVEVNGLAVSIGGVAPFATVKVDHIGGFVSLLDSIVSMREIKYGIRTPAQVSA